MRHVFDRVLGVALPNPLPRMTYGEAMSRYGTDRPDLRNPLELVEVGDLVASSEFKVFAGPANDSNARVGCTQGARGGSAGTLGHRRLHPIRRDPWREGACLHQGE